MCMCVSGGGQEVPIIYNMDSGIIGDEGLQKLLLHYILLPEKNML